MGTPEEATGMAEMTVTMAGAVMLAALREDGAPYPLAVMTALRVAFATCLAFAMMGGGS